ncbi:hypothetical protein C2S51_014383 [Perilla frutescens var. frutescens]|nr:hypothetical protein C2S51_014383 [Perilla frutescens var. frutescens]
MLEQILNPEEIRWIIIRNKSLLESLLQKATSLKHVLENFSGPKIESLDSRIRDATQKAEDIVERHMVDQVLSRRRRVRFSFPTPDLQHVMEEFDSAMEQAVKTVEEKTKKLSGSSSGGAAIFPDHPGSKNVLVGVDEDLMQLKDRLTGQESKLQIIPIVGMGGIGKTKLVQNLYDDPLIVSHFDVCAWATISQDYNVRAILLGLLRLPNEKLDNELIERTENHELKDILYKKLYSRRYLIVLDDMWNTDSWDDIQWCFPDNINGSRIMLTTRESDVAKYVGTQSLQYKMKLLNMSKSWNLLHQIVFREEDCPYALKGIGKKIAGDCGGLPLAINVIGGLLSKANRSRDVWEHIANDVSEAMAETDDDEFSNVLTLSYNHLPNHLKPCFLYIGAFPKDYQIKATRLIRMWVAEGFVKSNGDKSLEEVAEDYLDALVERNLVLVTRNRSNGEALSYGMHDILRDLCMRKAGEEKFLHVKKERGDVRLDKVRRVSIQTSYGMEEDLDAMSLARSLIYTGRVMSAVIPSLLFLVLRLVRVLDVYGMQFEEFPTEMLQLVNLRYLAFSCNCKSDIPRDISRLLNLQTLIARLRGGRLPSEIWKMSELRHLKLDTIIFMEEGSLQLLVLDELNNLVRWRADETNFPILRHLSILDCPLLEEIPSGIGDIPTLQQIDVYKCNPCVEASAKEIQKAQQSEFDNYGLQLRIW